MFWLHSFWFRSIWKFSSIFIHFGFFSSFSSQQQTAKALWCCCVCGCSFIFLFFFLFHCIQRITLKLKYNLRFIGILKYFRRILIWKQCHITIAKRTNVRVSFYMLKLWWVPMSVCLPVYLSIWHFVLVSFNDYFSVIAVFLLFFLFSFLVLWRLSVA